MTHEEDVRAQEMVEITSVVLKMLHDTEKYNSTGLCAVLIAAAYMLSGSKGLDEPTSQSMAVAEDALAVIQSREQLSVMLSVLSKKIFTASPPEGLKGHA